MLKFGAKLFTLLTLFFCHEMVFADGLIPIIMSSLPSCVTNEAIQIQRSEELHQLVTADQKERENWESKTNEEWEQLSENDLQRRKRVGELLGEGCIKTTKDYYAAALIFQHGNVPDHYFQAFIWALRAVELGDLSQKDLIGLTIDRYLISIGKKQLFGSQAYRDNINSSCYCLQPTEQSFSDEKRLEYTDYTLQQRYEWLASINDAKCDNKECLTELQPTLSGSIPGFW